MKHYTASTLYAAISLCVAIGIQCESRAGMVKLAGTANSTTGPMWFSLEDGPQTISYGTSREVPTVLSTTLQLVEGGTTGLESRFLSYRVDVPGGEYSYDFQVTRDGITNHFNVEFTSTDSFIEFSQQRPGGAFHQSNGDIVVYRELFFRRFEPPQVEWTLRHIESGESRTGAAAGHPRRFPDEFTLYSNRLTEVDFPVNSPLPTSAVLQNPELGASFGYYENWYAELGGENFTLFNFNYGGFRDFESLHLSMVPEPSSIRLALLVLGVVAAYSAHVLHAKSTT